ncbi:MAG: MCE family protein [Streptosporangiales bacterium]|nr:MCE family protein [Streptosporangiales bacterium]
MRKLSTRGLLTRVIVLVAVCGLLGGVLVVVFDNVQEQPQHTYRARFTDVSGLATGDDVLAAGDDVGRVNSITLEPDNQVMVSFTVANSVPVTQSTSLTVRYADVLGNRYLEVGQPATPDSPKLAANAVIPATRTQPALDLDALFNGFQPLFQGLQPAQINALSAELIDVLQGEGGTVDDLLGSIGTATATLAHRDQLIGQVIGNLNSVLGTVNTHSTQLSAFVIKLQQLISGLAADRNSIGSSIGDIGGMTSTLAGLLQQARPQVSGSVTQLGRLAQTVNNNQAQLNKTMSQVPEAYSRLGRQGLYGAFFQFYLCSVTIRFTGADGKPMSTPAFSSEAKRCQH